MGGAIRRVPDDATAFPHRDARWLINVPGQWADPADTDDEIAWVRDTFATLTPFLSGGAYSNFMQDDEDDSADTAYGETLARLAEIKADVRPGQRLSAQPEHPPGQSACRLTFCIELAAMTSSAETADVQARRERAEATQRELWGRHPRDWARAGRAAEHRPVRRRA